MFDHRCPLGLKGREVQAGQINTVSGAEKEGRETEGKQQEAGEK